jgi:hypothetical protein
MHLPRPVVLRIYLENPIQASPCPGISQVRTDATGDDTDQIIRKFAAFTTVLSSSHTFRHTASVEGFRR